MTNKQFLILIRVLIWGFNSILEKYIQAQTWHDNNSYACLGNDSHFINEDDLKAWENE